jgi:hypothetical protein
MFNTNVGDMPLDIFSDYISDTLGQEWSWEYFSLIANGNNFFSFYRFGDGCHVGNLGNSDGFLIYEEIFYNFGNGEQGDFGHGFTF